MHDETPPPDAEYVIARLDQLEFDEDNPRFVRGPVSPESGGPLGYLARHSNIVDLMQSIGAQGFFPGEPIMVVEREGTDKLTVIEGNRRYAACRLLMSPEEAPEDLRTTIQSIADSASFKPDRIPALKFGQETDILRFLGYRHISGVQEWSPLAKARYVKRLFNTMATGEGENERLAWVAERIGASPTYVARLMTSLELYERSIADDFFGLSIKPEELSFSLITVAINRRAISQFLGLQSSKDFHAQSLNVAALTDLLDWIFVKRGAPPRTVLGDSRNIRFLAEVIAEKTGEALRVLGDSHDLDQAHAIATRDENAVLGHILDAQSSIEAVEDILVVEERPLAFEEMSELSKVEDALGRIKAIAAETSVAGKK